jgi:RNA-directed DNA polymerase
MGKDGSVVGGGAGGDESLNNGESAWPSFGAAERRVLDHQRKLHRWASAGPDRRFGDVFNLICDRATLVVAWERVCGNQGSVTPGVDGQTRVHIGRDEVEPFLRQLCDSLRDGSFRPLPVRQVAIPKKSGKSRLLGIPTLRDRVAQMALKLILEPIFEVDFYPSSYGYRPGRRAQDAIAEIHQLTSRSYEWVVEGDITACFDNVDHQILMDLVGERIADRKVLRLVRAFLRAGIVEQHGGLVAPLTGTPQGGGLCSAAHKPPCGVPASVFRSARSSVRTPAFRNAFTRSRTRLSPIRTRTRSIRAGCEISSKQALMSPSTTQSNLR